MISTKSIITLVGCLALFLYSLSINAAETLPAVAALYQIQTESQAENEDVSQALKAHSKEINVQSWRLWRNDKTVELENLDSSVGEVWQQLVGGQVAYSWLLHRAKFAIRYQPSDLKAVNNHTDWATKVSLVSPKLLTKLKKYDAQPVFGWETELYAGHIGDFQLQITWIPALKMPVSIIQKWDRKQTVMTLMEIYPYAEAPWRPKKNENYEDMDFADIGDNEAHPLVKFYQRGMNLTTIQYPHQH